MSETPITSYTTAGGRTVDVLQVTVDRTTDLDEAAAASGPIWRCGCGDGSDKPLNNPLFGDPAGIVTAAAAGHAANCHR